MGYKNYKKEDYYKAVELKEKGFNMCQISKELNVPRSTIRGWIKTGFIFRDSSRTGYSDSELKEAASNVTSMAQLLKTLGLQAAGGNYTHIRNKLVKMNISCEHWKGQGWNNGLQLKECKDYSRNSNLKINLIKTRGHKCEDCQLEHWKNYPIPLELHHIDGNNQNNETENIQLLCCNCHAQTPSFRRPKHILIKKENGIETRQPILCPDCNNVKSFKAIRCFKCSHIYKQLNRNNQI
jgi:hypothetical protein